MTLELWTKNNASLLDVLELLNPRRHVVRLEENVLVMNFFFTINIWIELGALKNLIWSKARRRGVLV